MAVGLTIPVLGLNMGFPGEFSRGASGDRFVVAKQANASNTLPIKFGDALVVVPDSTGGTFRNVADFITQGGTMTADRFAGVAHREVKTDINLAVFQTTQSVTPFTGGYAAGTMTEAGVRGSKLVTCLVGTPVAENPVYLRIALNGAFPAGVVGGFEAVADGANTINLGTVGVFFKTGRLDGNSTTEITMTTRVSA